MIGNNWIAFGITLALAFLWLRFMDFVAQRGWISSRLSRKIIHIGTGPIFVLCWLLFDNQPSGRFLAALIPLAITIQFMLVGFGWIKDEASVKAMSRSGDRKEILRGPLIYGIVFVVVTLFYWQNPIGMVALMVLCGGDGIADVVGIRMESPKIPWALNKTVAGSISLFIGGSLLSLLVLFVFSLAGRLPATLSSFMPGVLVISFVAMLVESLPFKDIDNLTVPLASVILGQFLFGALL